MNALIPPDYERAMINAFHDRLIEQDRAWERLSGIDPDNRPTRYVEQPRDPAWIAARADFAQRWAAITAEGIQSEWLDREACYECGGALKITEDTAEWVEEPNPDYDAAKPNPYAHQAPSGTITIPRTPSA